MAAVNCQWVAAAFAVVVMCGGCKRDVVSQGACDGSVGATAVTAPLSATSAYEVNWSETSRPIALRLDCGGALVMTVEMAEIPSAAGEQWRLPSDDPACSGAVMGGARKGADAGQVTCVSNSALSWNLSAPHVRPLLSTGTLRTTSDSTGGVLRGEASLRFVDGTSAEIRFSLVHGEVADTAGSTSPRVSPIPGRIDF